MNDEQLLIIIQQLAEERDTLRSALEKISRQSMSGNMRAGVSLTVLWGIARNALDNTPKTNVGKFLEDK